MTLTERTRRLIDGSDRQIAAFAPEGRLLAATDSAQALLCGATSLAGLELEALAAQALASGHATGRRDGGEVSSEVVIDRLGSESATVLIACFGAPRVTLESPTQQAIAATPAASPEPAAPEPAERRHPLRFAWQMDEEQRFTLDSDEFVALTGPRTKAAIGKPWREVAAMLGLDPEGQIARAIDTRDTWSGVTIFWPVDSGPERLAVELSGLPAFDRERTFRGYRGFGACRDLAQLTALAQRYRSASRAAEKPTPSPDEPAAAPDQATPVEAPPAINIVPFPAAAEPVAPALSPVERSAFRELSRKLSQRLSAAGIEHQNRHDVASGGDDRIFADIAIVDLVPDVQPIFDRLSVGILIYRLDQLIYANPAFLRWTGHRDLAGLIAAGGLDELFIKPIGAVVPSDDKPLTLSIDRGDRIGIEGELINIHWSGEPAHALVTAAHPGERAKLELAQAELAELRKTEEALTAAKRQAEAASSAKSDFLAKISHEVRTPLNAVIGFSEVMMEERFGPIGNERYRDYIKDIHASGAHLLSLINDLLDLSKIEAGKLELTFTGVALNDLTQQCVAIMQPHANRERIIIRTSLPQALPQVVADARSVRQIVLNLLSNSIKFTSAGGQVIVSTALDDSGDVVLRVRDTGIGMSAQDLVTALEPFRQVATAVRGGTGLGLPLTKALAEANRASFQIKSAPKEGTLVEIAFPATRVLAG
jgi:signal transduction histidine kinase